MHELVLRDVHALEGGCRARRELLVHDQLLDLVGVEVLHVHPPSGQDHHLVVGSQRIVVLHLKDRAVVVVANQFDHAQQPPEDLRRDHGHHRVGVAVGDPGGGHVLRGLAGLLRLRRPALLDRRHRRFRRLRSRDRLLGLRLPLRRGRRGRSTSGDPAVALRHQRRALQVVGGVLLPVALASRRRSRVGRLGRRPLQPAEEARQQQLTFLRVRLHGHGVVIVNTEIEARSSRSRVRRGFARTPANGASLATEADRGRLLLHRRLRGSRRVGTTKARVERTLAVTNEIVSVEVATVGDVGLGNICRFVRHFNLRELTTHASRLLYPTRNFCRCV